MKRNTGALYFLCSRFSIGANGFTASLLIPGKQPLKPDQNLRETTSDLKHHATLRELCEKNFVRFVVKKPRRTQRNGNGHDAGVVKQLRLSRIKIPVHLCEKTSVNLRVKTSRLAW
ncbi:MAG TPA: hypothetical protein VFU15_07065 [Bacteroidia bacterium]|nr:hypothetical protein [Bacteroidia bacterium]